MQEERRLRLIYIEEKKKKIKQKELIELNEIEILNNNKIKKKNEYFIELMNKRQIEARISSKQIKEKNIKLKFKENEIKNEENEVSCMYKEDIRTILYLKKIEINREKKRNLLILNSQTNRNLEIQQAKELAAEKLRLNILSSNNRVPKQIIDPLIMEAKLKKKELIIEKERLKEVEEEAEKIKHREESIKKERFALQNRLAERIAIEKREKLEDKLYGR